MSNDFLPIQERAVSSVVEHYLDMVGVTGSNPVPRTISLNKVMEWSRDGSRDQPVSGRTESRRAGESQDPRKQNARHHARVGLMRDDADAEERADGNMSGRNRKAEGARQNH